MTDQQRGAYTPQQDVPLQFDPRSPASRRPMPMALIASGTLLVMLIAAVAMYYSRGVRGDNEPPRPVGEPVAVLKSAPAAGAQPTESTDGLDVSAPQNVPGQKAPAFAAAPEVPKPRPAPAAPTRLTVQTLSAADMTKPEAAPSPTAKTAASQTTAPQTTAPQTTAPKTAVTVATTPASELPAAPTKPVALVKAAAPATKPATAPAAIKATAVTTSASPATGARVQIGAFSSAALADKGYSDVAALLAGSMSGKAKHVEPVDKDGATLYRTSVTGFADRASAAAFCDALKAKGKICFVKN